MKEREFWEPRDPDKPLTASDVHEAIMGAGTAVSRIHAERTRGDMDLVQNRLDALLSATRSAIIPLNICAVGMICIAVRLVFFY